MACTRAPNGSRTTVVRAAKPAAATTRRTSHRRDGMSATSRAPNGVKPSTTTSTSQTPRLESPQGRTAEWYADSRAICAAVKSRPASGWTWPPGTAPGSGCHGVVITTTTTNATRSSTPTNAARRVPMRWQATGDACTRRQRTRPPRRATGRAQEALRQAVRRTPGVQRARHPPRRTDLQRRGADDQLLRRPARVPAGRADGEPRLPGVVALLLRPRQQDAARLLRLPRARARAGAGADRRRAAHRDRGAAGQARDAPEEARRGRHPVRRPATRDPGVDL